MIRCDIWKRTPTTDAGRVVVTFARCDQSGAMDRKRNRREKPREDGVVVMAYYRIG